MFYVLTASTSGTRVSRRTFTREGVDTIDACSAIGARQVEAVVDVCSWPSITIKLNHQQIRNSCWIAKN